ncbi:MAG: IS630 family transposase, partial [bacterium]|nr:IS630 family transposase [bacterium]
KRLDIQNAISSENHTLLFLPTYSPDLNPIEKKWAQIKSIRKKENLTIDQLYERHFIMN